MALSQVYTAVIGHVITAARWNNEFGNIYANGTDVAFPLTKAVSLAGFTLTLDGAGATTLSSTASQGFILSPGTKSGTPGLNGSFLNLASATFTDTNTGASGTAAVWNGTTVRTPTLAASNLTVTTTDASTLHIEAGPTAGTNETLTNSWAISTGGDVKVGGDLIVRKTDSSRTATVDTPLIVESVTTGTPAAGIGTGILVRAESQDENPSDIGQIDFTFSDRTTASEDSYCQILLRVAGAALAAAYRFVSTTAFRAIFTHANTADRTYTLPNRDLTIGNADFYMGPSSTGSGSAAAHEGTVTISASQALSGIHFYTDFTLDAGDTLTIADNAGRLCIVATGTITINGTIDGIGAGGLGATATAATHNGRKGGDGTSQPGGGGGGGEVGLGGDGGNGGHASGGVGGNVAAGGAQGQDNTGALVGIAHPFNLYGGGGGGAGGGGATEAGGAGGNGGASIVLVAPNVILGAAAVMQTSGANGTNGTAGVGQGGGGGGGGSAGNVYVFCRSYTDNGATFTQTAGTAGTGAGGAGAGAAGRAGVRQVNIYA